MIKSINQYQPSNVTRRQLHGTKAGSQHQHCRSQMTNKWKYKCSQSQVNTSGYLSVTSRWTKGKQSLHQPGGSALLSPRVLLRLVQAGDGRRPGSSGEQSFFGFIKRPGQKIEWQWGEIGSGVLRIHGLLTVFPQYA